MRAPPAPCRCPNRRRSEPWRRSPRPSRPCGKSVCISGSRVRIPAIAGDGCIDCSRRFSSCSSWTRNARSMVTASRSGSNGLVQKSCAPSPMARSALARSFCPVSTMTLVSGASTWIASSSASPSVGIVRMRRQSEVHGHDRRLVAAQLRDRRFAVAGHDRFVLVEGPAHLLLQRRVVLDDQQGLSGLGHATSFAGRAGAIGIVAARQQDADPRARARVHSRRRSGRQARSTYLRAFVDSDPHAGRLGGLERPEQPVTDEFRRHARRRCRGLRRRRTRLRARPAPRRRRHDPSHRARSESDGR